MTVEKLLELNQQITEALKNLVSSIDKLASESQGVAGLHLNGDIAAWDEILDGGAYADWLGTALSEARSALEKTGVGKR